MVTGTTCRVRARLLRLIMGWEAGTRSCLDGVILHVHAQYYRTTVHKNLRLNIFSLK